MSFALRLWEELSVIDMSRHIKSKGGKDYIPWTSSWSQLKALYPMSEYEWESETAPDGTMSVSCNVRIYNHEEECRKDQRDYVEHHINLAVMNHKFQAVINPSSTAINNAKARCLVKAIAMHGLGINVYAGEDVEEFFNSINSFEPVGEEKKKTPQVKISDENRKKIEDLCVASNSNMDKLLKSQNVSDLSNLNIDQVAQVVLMLETKIKRLEKVSSNGS